MALPHLVVDRKHNTNFKNRYEADFVSKSRKDYQTRTSRDALVERQTRYDNFNASYDRLISDNAYEKSLSSYINLRNKARKDQELIGRRDRLAYLLKREREMYMDELRAMNTPKCDILYDEIRQKGFFELLYEGGDVSSNTRRIPPHLVSEYEQDLYGIGEDAVSKAKNDVSQKKKMREFLMNQQHENLQKHEDERQQRIEEELESLRLLKLKDESDRLESEKQKYLRKAMAKDRLSDVRSSRKYEAALQTAIDEAADEEAMRENAKWIARRALDEARRQELQDETRRVQAEQVEERMKEERMNDLRKVDERRENEEMDRRLAAERELESRRKFASYQMNRQAYDEQVAGKYERRRVELDRMESEREDERQAEVAYHVMLEREAERLKTRPRSDHRLRSYRY